MALLYPAKSIKADTPLAKYCHAAVINTLILNKNACGLEADVAGAMPRDGAFP